MVYAIVSVDKNWGIGYNGKLLAYIPEDMRFFKEKTTNNIVIMGRKTYESLSTKPLPHRINIVVTSKIDKPCVIEDNTMFVTMDFIKMFLSTLSPNNPMNYYIIGGGQIYKELLPFCDTAYVTKLDHAYGDVDTYFPNLDEIENWEEWYVSDSGYDGYNAVDYRFCIYKKKVEQNG
jgi:dihydrofolate reductase